MKQLIGLAVAVGMGPPVLPEPPADAEAVCGPVRNGREHVLAWALRHEYTGLHYWLGRFTNDGKRVGEPIDIGWGYDGNPTCVVGANRGRVAVVWPWFDPYGGTPELRIAIVEGERNIAQEYIVRSMCFDFEPVAIEPVRDGGWVVHYRCADDNEDRPIDHVAVDRDGRRR